MLPILEVFRGIAFVVLKIVEYIFLLKSLPYYFMKPKRCPPIDNKILFCTATTLAEKIRNRELKSETIIQAYVSRILAVNPILNAVVEDCFFEAINKAKSVDEMLATTKLTPEELKTKYPLLGVPMTIKGSIAVKNMDHGSGRVFSKKKIASRDARVVQLIRDAGAIPLLVSNTPELCMSLETVNNVTGLTNNPYDTRRTPGGSSGGEAALLGSGASVIGIGSDMLGSIRVPAHYCGIWGHKPTAGAISIDGHYPDSRKKEPWTSLLTFGPLCRYASDLLLLYKVIADRPLQLDDQVHLKNLKYYIMENDGGSILTHPIEDDILVAMRKFKSHLERKYDVKVKQLKLNNFNYVETVHIQVLRLTEIDTLFDDKNKNPYSELLRFITGQSSATLMPILQGILQGLVTGLPSSVHSWADYQVSQTKEKLLAILGVDGVLLYPTHPAATHIHGQMIGRYFDFHYTGLFNGLGLPVTQCPLGLNSQGLPIGMQVIASPNNDRLTLAVAREVEVVFGGWVPPPSSTATN